MADAIKKGADAVKDKVSGNAADFERGSLSQGIDLSVEVSSGASYEANKSAAKDSNRSVGDRVTHGTYRMKQSNGVGEETSSS